MREWSSHAPVCQFRFLLSISCSPWAKTTMSQVLDIIETQAVAGLAKILQTQQKPNIYEGPRDLYDTVVLTACGKSPNLKTGFNRQPIVEFVATGLEV